MSDQRGFLLCGVRKHFSRAEPQLEGHLNGERTRNIQARISCDRPLSSLKRGALPFFVLGKHIEKLEFFLKTDYDCR